MRIAALKDRSLYERQRLAALKALRRLTSPRLSPRPRHPVAQQVYRSWRNQREVLQKGRPSQVWWPIKVRDEALPRAIAFLDLLFSKAAAAGHMPHLDHGHIRLTVAGEHVGVHLHDTQSKAKDGTAVTRLRFDIRVATPERKWWMTWGDSSLSPLEEFIPDIIQRLAVVAPIVRAARLEDEASRDAYRADKRRAEQATLRDETLEADLAAWEQAERVRRFAVHVHQRFASADGELADQLSAWLAWADERAKELDRLAAGPKEFLGAYNFTKTV